MNIGQKINILFERSGYKNYKDWGDAMGLPGDWLLDMKKKDIVKNVDVTRLQVITKYNQVTVDWLLGDNIDNSIDIKSNLADNDLYKLFDQIQVQLQDNEVEFNGFLMNEKSKEIAYDAIEIIKGLIANNL